MMLAALFVLAQGAAPLAAPAATDSGVELGVDRAVESLQDPVEQAQTEREQARRWWEQLSEEQRQHYRRRHEELQQLSEEEREELRRRGEAVERSRRRAWTELPVEEQERLSALPEAERSAGLDRLVEERFRRRQREIEARFGTDMPGGPGPGDMRGRPLHERLDASSRWMEKLHGKDLQAELEKLHQQGWIGDKAAEWLRTAPMAEQAAAMLDARKWRGLAHAREKGHFSEWRLDEHEQRMLAEMPSRDSLIAMKELQRGLPKEEVFAPRGPGGFGPFPGDRRGRGRRFGGERPERGDRPDRPNGPGGLEGRSGQDGPMSPDGRRRPSRRGGGEEGLGPLGPDRLEGGAEGGVERGERGRPPRNGSGSGRPPRREGPPRRQGG